MLSMVFISCQVILGFCFVFFLYYFGGIGRKKPADVAFRRCSALKIQLNSRRVTSAELKTKFLIFTVFLTKWNCIKK